MWYWLIKFQEMLLIPPFLIYYSLRRISFSLKCKHCGRWITERKHLSEGICQNCYREMAICGNWYTLMSNQYSEREIKRIVYPTKLMYDSIYRRVVPRVGQGKILDVGCGQGFILSGVKSPSSDLYGIDVFRPAIKAAKNWTAGVNFCVADARNIPYRHDTFDYVICTDVLEHIEGNGVVNECYRVLKPSGVAFFTVPNGNGTSGRTDPTHIRLFTFQSVLELLEGAGFDVVSGQKFALYIPFVSPFFELLLQVSGRRLPVQVSFDMKVPEFLATEFFIECTKPSVEKGKQG
jgi:2-polyprenyl-3-methyl-5-hydroxy-6-metoxy-1,4-benzoquinol methylase